ncbi:MAG TPA: DUF177 domain-containing protein [Ktedonobacteraceae bacterium]
MIFNVAQLVKSPVGTSLEADLNEESVQLDKDLKLVGPLTGHVRMRHINQGLLIDGWGDITLELECTRCLKHFERTLHVPFEERFFPTVDVLTGVPLPPFEEDDIFPIDEHHLVDLTEAIRQRAWLEIPMVVLCKEDCAGLCSQCGHDLNLGPCNCEPEVDTRLNVLKTLLQSDS